MLDNNIVVSSAKNTLGMFFDIMMQSLLKLHLPNRVTQKLLIRAEDANDDW
jgi:hypothetical protein